MRSLRSSFGLARALAAGFSLLGMAAMAAVSARQLGLVRHLPDPPWRGFDSDKVNMSDDAWILGLVPDGPVALGSLALNLPLALMGRQDRARRGSLLPIAFAAKAAVEALVGSFYFYKMPARQKAWCGYCIIGAAANWAIFASAVPEALAAWRARRAGEA
jgi:hypothetical protein